MKVRTQLNAGGNPRGSYQNSCDNIYSYPQKNYIMLGADCEKFNKQWVPATLKVPNWYTDEISNCNGKLKLGYCKK